MMNKHIYQAGSSSSKNDSIEVKRQIIAAHHKFLWDENKDKVNSLEKEIAKTYNDQLFKEFCIGDLNGYKLNKIALRWRTKKEVISGKGETMCGNKECDSKEDLRSWEVNFRYVEHGKANNALVKLRLCPPCSLKLNYHKKKKEWVDDKDHSSHKRIEKQNKANTDGNQEISSELAESTHEKENDVWNSAALLKIDKNSNEQMTAYLLDLFYLEKYNPN